MIAKEDAFLAFMEFIGRINDDVLELCAMREELSIGVQEGNRDIHIETDSYMVFSLFAGGRQVIATTGPSWKISQILLAAATIMFI